MSDLLQAKSDCREQAPEAGYKWPQHREPLQGQERACSLGTDEALRWAGDSVIGTTRWNITLFIGDNTGC